MVALDTLDCHARPISFADMSDNNDMSDYNDITSPCVRDASPTTF